MNNYQGNCMNHCDSFHMQEHHQYLQHWNNLLRTKYQLHKYYHNILAHYQHRFLKILPVQARQKEGSTNHHIPYLCIMLNYTILMLGP